LPTQLLENGEKGGKFKRRKEVVVKHAKEVKERHEEEARDRFRFKKETALEQKSNGIYSASLKYNRVTRTPLSPSTCSFSSVSTKKKTTILFKFERKKTPIVRENLNQLRGREVCLYA
jgi:hypothetical protein